jgi:hypothetical protein
MPFQQNTAFPEIITRAYGKYHSTFHSQTDQVLAQLFEREGWLIAHVSFPGDVKPDAVTDSYLSELQHYAPEHGFAGKLRIIYAD